MLRLLFKSSLTKTAFLKAKWCKLILLVYTLLTSVFRFSAYKCKGSIKDSLVFTIYNFLIKINYKEGF